MTNSPTGPADVDEVSSPGEIDGSLSTDWSSTDSGLKYRVLRLGDGGKPKPSDAVEVDYKGWLDDDTVFDSSYRRGETITFPLGGVIAGWTEGLQLIECGGMVELEIPFELGYGPSGMPPVIPPSATLHFLVELHEIK